MATHSNTPISRRSFLRGRFLNTFKSEQEKQQGLNAIRPPWANLATFLDQCSGCDECVKACEMGILVKGAGGYPEVDFYAGRKACSFCEKCVGACPEKVFRPTGESAWQHKVDIQPNCLAFAGVECRACQDSCENRAFQFQRKVGYISTPILNLENCNGCGMCLNSCPTQSIHLLIL